MKHMIMGALLLLSLQKSLAQTDSAQLNAGPLTLQARDAEYLATFIPQVDSLNAFYEDLKTRFRIANPLMGTTTVSVAAISAGNLLLLFSEIRRPMLNMPLEVFSRIDNAIRACQNTYVQYRINRLDTIVADQYKEQRRLGRMKLRGKAD
jgi:hypothetical protein